MMVSRLRAIIVFVDCAKGPDVFQNETRIVVADRVSDETHNENTQRWRRVPGQNDPRSGAFPARLDTSNYLKFNALSVVPHTESIILFIVIELS